MRHASRFLSLVALLGTLGCGGSAQIEDIAWVGIASKNSENSVEFFKEILELPVLQVRDGVVDFALPSGQIFTIFDQKQVQLLTGDYPLVGFGVKDIVQARRYFRKRGVDFVDAVQGRWDQDPARWTHFKDPEGHIYELNQDKRHLDARWFHSLRNRLRIRSIAFVGMPVLRTFPETSALFEDSLELQRAEMDVPFQMSLFTLPSGRLFEIMGPDVPDVSLTNYALLGFEVDDIYEALRILQSRGVPIVGTPRDQGDVAWFFFRGPQGLVYEIIQIRRQTARPLSELFGAPILR